MAQTPNPDDCDDYSFDNREPIDFEEYRRKKEELRQLQKHWLEKRALLWAHCESDPLFKAAVEMQCQQDPLFWFDYFAWTYDPRELQHERVKPFILYPYQRELVVWLLELIEMTLGEIETVNAILEKSRDMGASWVVFLFVLWYWWFRNGSFSIVSRKEEEVDKRGDMSTAFEKLRFCLRHIQNGFSIPETMQAEIKKLHPNADFHKLRCGFPWLMPEGFNFKDHDMVLLLINPTGGEITGESANANATRGGRETMVIFDELGHIEKDREAWDAAGGTSQCLLGLGTPNGPNGVLAELATGKTRVKVYKQTLHWHKHPLKGAGLTRDDQGRLTSPWYEVMKVGRTEEWIARELDISYSKSIQGLIFPGYTILHHARGLSPVQGKPMIVIFDPGVHFFVLFMQVDNYARVLALHEIYNANAHVRDVGFETDQVIKDFKRKHPGIRFLFTGDPAGAVRQASSAEEPEYDTFRDEFGWNVDYYMFKDMPTKQREKTRINAIDNRLRTISAQTSTPTLLVDRDRCKILHEALAEKYRRGIDRRTGILKPDIDVEHPWEDAVDCLGYGVVFKLGPLGSKEKRRGSEGSDREEIGSSYSSEGDYRRDAS